MEAIKTYLDNVFAAFPQTERVQAMKQEMLENMVDKYHELKREGMSEHEAIGNVISNFGSIDEIADEMKFGKKQTQEDDDSIDYLELSHDEALDYVAQNKKSALWFGFGVILIMAGISALMLISGPSDGSASTFSGYFTGIFNSISQQGSAVDGTSTVTGVFVLFISIALAIPMFIVNGIRMSRYENYYSHAIKLDSQTSELIERERAMFLPRFATLISAGVVLVLLAVGSYIYLRTSTQAIIPVVVLLMIVGVAALLFISAGMRYSAYELLLGKMNGNQTLAMRKSEKIIGTVAAAYWPLIVAVYLLISFLSGAWHSSWIVWPVAGVLFAAFAGGIGAWYSTQRDH